MHYLVTGGCGFIGSHLIELLLAGGHQVTVIDDLSTGKRENIPSKITVKVADVTTPQVFDEFVGKVDGCFHLAAIVSVQKSAEEWLRTHQVNQSALVALFDAMIKKNRKIPVVYASSAAAYGDCEKIPLKETEHTTPISAYGVDKLTCEYQAHIATSLHNIPTIGLRFFNVYGPRQDPLSPYSGVISIFANRFKQQLPVSIYGDGEQTRDFVYVGDVARGLILSMQKLESNPPMHSVLNICTGTKISINTLAKTLIALTKSTSQVVHAEPRTGDIRHSTGDATSARVVLGFEAKMKLETGLELTLKSL